MARIIGVEVPPNKRIDIALRYIYGIGPTNAKEVLVKAKIDPSIRAIVCSGYYSDPVMANNRKFGFNGVLQKPFSIEELKRVLNETLEQAR